MSARPLGLALLGCGYAARLAAAGLKPLGGAVRCFYASRDAQRARSLMTDHIAAAMAFVFEHTPLL